MDNKLIRVFYSKACMPFKDKERTVHFPVVGNAFMNASNTTEIRFFVSEIGGGASQWVVIAKLPNGKRGFKFLTPSASVDSESGESYVYFTLDSFFTQAKGDLYLSLGSYKGSELSYDSEEEIYELEGNPIVETTSPIKLSIDYSIGVEPSDERIDTWQELLGLIGTKPDKNQVIIQYETIASLNADFSNYEVGQLFYCQEDCAIYKNTGSSLPGVVFQNVGLVYRGASITNDTVFSGNTLLLLTKRFSLLNYQNELYVKYKEDSDYVYFANRISISNNDYYYTITENNIRITKASGAVNVSSASYNVGNKTGLDSKLGKAKTTNADTYISTFTNDPLYGNVFELEITGEPLYNGNYLVSVNDNSVTILDLHTPRYFYRELVGGETLSNLSIGSVLRTIPNVYITNRGNHTIFGVMTFSTLPQSTLAPTNLYDFVNKEYVDSKTGNVGDTTESSTTLQGQINSANSEITNIKANYVKNSEKGNANGVATLDSSTKIPLSQIPNSVLGQNEYCGKWNANSNTNQLTDDHPLRKGDYYICQTSGTYNPQGTQDSPVNDYVVGDWAIYNGTSWDKIDNTDAVSSVNEKTGAVVLTGNDIEMGGDNHTKLSVEIDKKINETTADSKYQSKIIAYPLLSVPTTGWTQDSETGLWHYTTTVPSSELTIGEYDKYLLGANDSETSEELAVCNANTESITTTGDTTTIVLVASFQPTIALNVSIVVAKVTPGTQTGITFLTTGDIDDDTLKIVSSKLQVNKDRVVEKVAINNTTTIQDLVNIYGDNFTIIGLFADGRDHIIGVHKLGGNDYRVEIESLVGPDRYYTSSSYANPNTTINDIKSSTYRDEYITESEKGSANGIASLDSNAKVPYSQIPDTLAGSMKYAGIIRIFDSNDSSSYDLETCGVADLELSAINLLGLTGGVQTITVNGITCTGGSNLVSCADFKTAILNAGAKALGLTFTISRRNYESGYIGASKKIIDKNIHFGSSTLNLSTDDKIVLTKLLPNISSFGFALFSDNTSTKLYRHEISITGSSTFVIISTRASAYTANDFKSTGSADSVNELREQIVSLPNGGGSFEMNTISTSYNGSYYYLLFSGYRWDISNSVFVRDVAYDLSTSFVADTVREL